MLSTTTHLTTDIVAMPLLWVLPLGLYLLSFVVAFAGGAGRPIFITMVAPLIILIAGGLRLRAGRRHAAVRRRRSDCCLLFVDRGRAARRAVSPRGPPPTI